MKVTYFIRLTYKLVYQVLIQCCFQYFGRNCSNYRNYPAIGRISICFNT